MPSNVQLFTILHSLSKYLHGITYRTRIKLPYYLVQYYGYLVEISTG